MFPEQPFDEREEVRRPSGLLRPKASMPDSGDGRANACVLAIHAC